MIEKIVAFVEWSLRHPVFRQHLRQLLADSLIILDASRVETYGAAWVHLAERHLLWWGAMIWLDKKRQNTSENIHQAEGPGNCGAYIHTLHGRRQHKISCILHHLMNEILFICCHSIHKFTTLVCVTLYTTACKSIKQSCYTVLCAAFYVWVLKYSGSQYLILYLPYFS